MNYASSVLEACSLVALPTDVLSQLLWVLEHLASVTSQPAETPNEREFQSQYGDIISSALQRLRNPSNFAKPHTVWEPFKEVIYPIDFSLSTILFLY